MTIDSSTAVATYNGDNSTTVFAYPFRILAEGHVLVQLKDADDVYTTQVLTTDYSVSGVGDSSGGNITFTTAPASTETVIITRAMPFTQDTDYTANDLFPAEAHEEALDELTMMCQELSEKVDRCIKFGNEADNGASVILPDPGDNTGKYLKFKSDGTGIETASITALTSGATLLDEDDMVSNSATEGATQQSIKAYVDNEISGLGGAWTNVILGSDQTTTSASHSNVTGLAFTPAASTLYEIEVRLLCQSASTGNGTEIGVSWPTGYTDGAGTIVSPQSNTSDDRVSVTAGTSGNTTPTVFPGAANSWLVSGRFILRMGASPSGNFQVTFANEDGATTSTVKQYSYIRYKAIT